MANALTRSVSITSDRALDSGSSRLLPSPTLNRLHLPQQQQQQQLLLQPPILPPISPEARASALNRMQESRRSNSRSIVLPSNNRLPLPPPINRNSNSIASSSRSNVIDLTGSSPPSLALKIKGSANRRAGTSNAGAVAGGGVGGAGPSGIRRNSNSNVIVIDSDDDEEDGDVLPIPPPLTVSDDDDDVVIVEGSYAAPVIPRELRRNPPQVVRNETSGHRRFPPLPQRPIPAPTLNARQRAAQTISNGLDFARQQFFNHHFDEDDDEEDDEDFDEEMSFYDSEEAAQYEYEAREELALYGQGAERLTHEESFNRILSGMERAGGAGGDLARAALQNHFGYGNFIGLAGLMNKGGKKVAKKYGIRLSHPKGVEDGFSRDIIPPPELADTPPPEPAHHRGRKSKPKIPPPQMEPACAACLERLLLAQNGERKPWALKCGHVVCGKCIGEAKMRCEEIKEAERKNHWTYDVKGNEKVGAAGSKGKGKGKAEVVLLDDEDDSDDDKNESNFGPTRNSKNSKSTAPYSKILAGKGKGKGKEKSNASETGVDESWTCCPVVKCAGTTDLLAKDGDFSGPFELFI